MGENVRGGTDAERRRHGKMTREEAGRLGGEARGRRREEEDDEDYEEESGRYGGRSSRGRMSREEAGRRGGETVAEERG